MSEPFLILHKVRGEPAFDIATRIRCPVCQGVGGHNVPDFETGVVSDYEGWSCEECNGEGFWWIIPTSGHRAYPWYAIGVKDLHVGISNVSVADVKVQDLDMDNYPDHYPSKSSPPPASLSTIMSSILNTITPKLRR